MISNKQFGGGKKRKIAQEDEIMELGQTLRDVTFSCDRWIWM